MTEQISLKEIERKAYRSTFEDGLFDITWGIIILGIGYFSVIKNLGIPKPINFLLIPLLAISLFFLGKKFITVPRMGAVKFGTKRKTAKKKILITGALLLPIQVLLIILVKTGNFPREILDQSSQLLPPLVYCLILIIIFAVIAYQIDFPRLFYIGILFCASIITAELLFPRIGQPLDGIIPFTVSGLAVLSFGFFLLIRFIRNYPKPIKEESENG